MVLVDTSVWIRFLANREPEAAELDGLLSRDEVVGHEFVYGELLIGDRGGRKKILADYEKMHQAGTVPHPEVVAFVRDRDLHGRGVGWIDIHLLAAAIVGRWQVWTADPRFSALAQELGISYDPAASPRANGRPRSLEDTREKTAMAKTLTQLLSKYPPGVRALALDARHFILALFPGIQEVVDASTLLVAGYGYGTGYNDLICTVIVSKSGVKLGLVGGAELPDPSGLLEGRGKVHRYVQLHTSSDLKQPGLKALLRSAHAASKPRP